MFASIGPIISHTAERWKSDGTVAWARSRRSWLSLHLVSLTPGDRFRRRELYLVSHLLSSSSRSFALSFRETAAAVDDDHQDRASVRPSPGILTKSWRSCRVLSMWTSATPEVSVWQYLFLFLSALCLSGTGSFSMFRFCPSSVSVLLTHRWSEPARCSQLTTPAVVSWFLLATRRLIRVQPCKNSFCHFWRDWKRSAFVEHAAIYRRNTKCSCVSVALAIVRGGKGGGCPSLSFFLSVFFDCSQRAYSSHRLVSVVFVNADFLKIRRPCRIVSRFCKCRFPQISTPSIL